MDAAAVAVAEEAEEAEVPVSEDEDHSVAAAVVSGAEEHPVVAGLSVAVAEDEEAEQEVVGKLSLAIACTKLINFYEISIIEFILVYY